MKRMVKRFFGALLAAVMATTVLPVGSALAAGAQLYDLRVCDLPSPVGLDAVPVFRWKLPANKLGQAQTAYRIVVADNASLTDPVWDSGRVASDVSTGVTYSGSPLQPSTVYFWQATA